MADNKTSKQENRSFEVQQEAVKGNLPQNTIPQEQIPPTEGDTIGGEFRKEDTVIGTQRVTTDTQLHLDKLKEIVASEEDATKTEGSMPNDPILPEVRKKMEELAKKRREEIAQASRTDADAKGMPSADDSDSGDKNDSKESKPSKEDFITGNVKPQAANPEVDQLEKECNKILKEYGGLEGNIPVHSNYWGMRNAIRANLNKLNNL